MILHYSRLQNEVALRYSARKSPIGEWAIWLLVHASLRRMFVRVRIAGDDPRAAGLPLVVIANHPSWWDGYLALLLSRHFGVRRFLMMDAAQLRRYGFFAWAGCFGVERADAHDVLRGLAYTAALLREERPAWVWLFPQAEITPASARPLALHGGAAHILRRATAGGRTVGVLPVAWDLVFRGEQHPEIVVRVGAVCPIDTASSRDVARVTSRLTESLTAVMDDVARDIATDDLATYRTIFRGRGGINDAFDRLLGRSRLVADP